jgi:hypothetical protein
MNRTFLPLALPLLLAAATSPAARAETIDCTVIASVPATLSSQGVYCLAKDLPLNLESGAAITVATNNVTIDCNGFKLGNLAASDGTTAVGIQALQRLNTTVRGCGIRGFRMGVQLEGGGHLIEDNRLDFNRHIGVLVSGDGSTVRRNRIFSTGGGTTGMGSAGIHASYGVDVIDNLVSGVETLPATPLYAIGIFSNGNVGGVIEGNRIRGLAGGASGQTVGIDAQGSDAMSSLRANTLSATDGAGIGLQCQSTDSFADGNHVVGFGTASAGCTSGDAELHP